MRQKFHFEFPSRHLQSGYFLKLLAISFVIYAVLVVTFLAVLYPFLWMISISFKKTLSLFASTVLIPENPTIKNYVSLLTNFPFLRWMLNSIVVAGSVTLIKLFIDSMTGYVFAKKNFFGKNILFILIMSTIMVPFGVRMIPSFLIIKNMRLLNTYGGLILPCLANPIGIFLMRQFLSSLPSEIEDSARLDGCSEFAIYWRIILPLSIPALVVLAIFLFMLQWTDFLWPVIITRSAEMRTLTVGISVLKARWHSNWGLVMAASSLSILPMVVMFLFLQRYFLKGLTIGALKG